MALDPDQIRNADQSLIAILMDPDVPAAIKTRLRAAYVPPGSSSIDTKTVEQRRMALNGRLTEAQRNAAIDYLLSIQQGIDPDATGPT